MLLRLDLALGGEPPAQQGPAHRIAELGLGEKQEVVLAAPPDAQRSDQPPLRREQEGVDEIVARHVVRQEPLQEILRVRPGDAHVRARAEGDPCRRNCHGN